MKIVLHDIKIRKIVKIILIIVGIYAMLFVVIPNLAYMTGIVKSGEYEEKKITNAFVKALNARDKEGIKALFSEEFLIEYENVDEQIDNMFDFFDRSIFPIEKKDVFQHGGSEERSHNAGLTSVIISSKLDIQSENGKRYTVVFSACIEYPDPKHVGVYQIKVIDKTGLSSDNPDEYKKEINYKDRLCFVGKQSD